MTAIGARHTFYSMGQLPQFGASSMMLTAKFERLPFPVCRIRIGWRKCCLAARSRCPEAFTRLIDHFGYQFDVLLACRFAFRVFLDPGFPTPSIRHIAARKRELGDVRVLDAD